MNPTDCLAKIKQALDKEEYDKALTIIREYGKACEERGYEDGRDDSYNDGYESGYDDGYTTAKEESKED